MKVIAAMVMMIAIGMVPLTIAMLMAMMDMPPFVGCMVWPYIVVMVLAKFSNNATFRDGRTRDDRDLQTMMNKRCC